MNRELASIQINNKTYKITASHHAVERMEQRNVDAYVVASSVLALGPDRIDALQAQSEEAMIIDKTNNVSVVVGMNPNSITIITVINRANVYVKENTAIYNI